MSRQAAETWALGAFVFVAFLAIGHPGAERLQLRGATLTFVLMLIIRRGIS